VGSKTLTIEVSQLSPSSFLSEISVERKGLKGRKMTKSISLPSIEPYRSLSPKSSPFTNADAAEAENVNVKLDSNIEIHSNTMESLHDKKESARDDVSILSDTISPRTPAQKERCGSP
jgi:hypothetical protein